MCDQYIKFPDIDIIYILYLHIYLLLYIILIYTFSINRMCLFESLINYTAFYKVVIVI